MQTTNLFAHKHDKEVFSHLSIEQQQQKQKRKEMACRE